MKNLIGTEQVTLLTDMIPGGPLPSWISMTLSVLTVLLAVLFILIIILYFFRGRAMKNAGLDKSQLREKAEKDGDNYTVPDNVGNLNVIIKISTISFIVVAVLGILATVGNAMNDSDKGKIIDAVENTTGSSLDGGKVEGQLGESSTIFFEDDTKVHYELEHRGGLDYDVHVYSIERDSE